VKAAPFTAPLGWVVIASAVAAPNVKANEFEVTPVNDGVDAKDKVKFPAVPTSFNPLNVAMPELAVTVNVVESVPVPEAMAAVTVVVESDVTVLPPESTILITG